MNNTERLVGSSFFTIPAIIYCVEQNTSKIALTGLMCASYLMAFIIIGEFEDIWTHIRSLKKRAKIQCQICIAEEVTDDPLNIETEYSFLNDDND